MRIYHTGLIWHCLCAISRLGVAEQLAAGPLPVDALADRTGTRPDPLRRILRLLGDYGLFKSSGDEVALTDSGRILCKEHPTSAWSMFATVGLPDLAHTVEESLRTGQSTAKRVLGAPYWDYLATHPDQHAIFDDYMRTQTAILADACSTTLTWPASGTVADIGGGVGTLLAGALRAAPGLRGILVEQEQVLDRARAMLAAELAAGRCEVRRGDLFSPPPEADIYLLSYILHDWSDDDALRILRAVAERAPAGARLRLFECVVPDDGTPHPATMIDVGLLLLMGGRERTRGEFSRLLAQAGWRIDAIVGCGDASMIEASRVSEGN